MKGEIPMDDILLPMLACLLPSSSRRVTYTVTEVQPGSHVTITSPNRQKPSVLRWTDIARVYMGVGWDSPLTPTVVDAILENPQNWDSSTMCALVLAMQNPTRVQRASLRK